MVAQTAVTVPQTSEELANDPNRKPEQKRRKIGDVVGCLVARVQCSLAILRKTGRGSWGGRYVLTVLKEPMKAKREEQPVPWV